MKCKRIYKLELIPVEDLARIQQKYGKSLKVCIGSLSAKSIRVAIQLANRVIRADEKSPNRITLSEVYRSFKLKDKYFKDIMLDELKVRVQITHAFLYTHVSSSDKAESIQEETN